MPFRNGICWLGMHSISRKMTETTSATVHVYLPRVLCSSRVVFLHFNFYVWMNETRVCSAIIMWWKEKKKQLGIYVPWAWTHKKVCEAFFELNTNANAMYADNILAFLDSFFGFVLLKCKRCPLPCLAGCPKSLYLRRWDSAFRIRSQLNINKWMRDVCSGLLHVYCPNINQLSSGYACPIAATALPLPLLLVVGAKRNDALREKKNKTNSP